MASIPWGPLCRRDAPPVRVGTGAVGRPVVGSVGSPAACGDGGPSGVAAGADGRVAPAEDDRLVGAGRLAAGADGRFDGAGRLEVARDRRDGRGLGRRAGPGVVGGMAVGLTLGCAPGPDDWPVGYPRIRALRYLDQRPQNGSLLVFLLDFEDADGDLSGGAIELEVEERADAVLPMSELFVAQQPPLLPDATEGRLEVDVRLSSRVRPGERVEFGFALEDASGRRSNEPSLVLEAVDPARASQEGNLFFTLDEPHRGSKDGT